MFTYKNKQFKTGQELQDEIYRDMPADKKIEVAAGFWRLGKALDSDKIDFRKKYGNSRPPRPLD